VHLALGERADRVQLVVQGSTLDFDAPVQGDFAASSTLPPTPDWQRFLRTLERRGRARLAVTGELGCGGLRVGRHEGVYAAVGI
jgi:thioesterase domain-containing protein